jgi:hypothetical protein
MNFEEYNCISYNPIYEYTNIQPEKIISEYTKQVSYNEYEFIDICGNKKIGFKKFISLVDFVKFLIGKYKSEKLNILPSNDLEDNGSLYRKYIQSHNNYAYVDAFFYNLSSKLINKGFIHGINVYDNYLCIKKNFEINIAQDFEYLIDSNYFNEKLNKLFYFKDESISLMFKKDNIRLKELDISDVEESIDILNIEELDDIEDNDKINKNDNADNVDNDDNDENVENNNEIEELMVEEKTNETNEINENDSESDSESDNDSEISVTDNEAEEDDDDDEKSCNSSDYITTDDENAEEIESIDNESSSICNKVNRSSSSSITSSSEGDDNSFDGTIEDEISDLILVIKEMPTQVVCIEKCENTFDSLLENNITIEELESAMFQIIVILYTYQKIYRFTHNDLHTNNIMYISTDEPFLYYQIMGKNYKIPTFGRIYKIIDFGRAIYSVNDKLVCSDSFSVNGTAHTQYNFEPFFNSNKPIIKPNYSFDLCRLACSMLDFIIDELDDIDKFKEIPIYDLIISWIYDDSGTNILYKRNGEERYPDFKLYRMIARIVHNHLPENQFSHECFKKYITDNTDKSENNVNIMNIDEIIIL